MRSCPNGHDVTVDDTFCGVCGSPTVEVTRTAACFNGHPAPDLSIRFCGICGAEVAGTVPLVEGEIARDPRPAHIPRPEALPTSGSAVAPAFGATVSPTLAARVAPGTAKPKRMPYIVGAVLIGLLAVGGGSAILLWPTKPANSTAAPETSGAVSTTEPTPSTVRPSTTTTTAPTTTPAVLAITSELRNDWPYEPNKCGPDPSSHSSAHSSTRTYEVTDTVHLWSAPTTSATPLTVISVPTFGAGGNGCPDGAGPTVTVECVVSAGEPISGPFGTDAIWLRTTVDGQTGYLPDEWVDTKWDTPSLPQC